MKRSFTIVAGLILLTVGARRGWAHQDLPALIARLTEQLRTNRNDLEVLLLRADLYRLHSNWPEACADYAAAIESSPRSAAALIGQAQLHADMGEQLAARRAFDAALVLAPTNCAALFGRAPVLARLGERQAAIADYSRGLALTRHPQPDHFLERAGLQAVELGPDAAIAGLDEGLARLGWLVTLQQRAMDLELKRQRPDLALIRLETILARAGRKESWLAMKGEILLEAGKTSEAQAVLSEALKHIAGLAPRLRTSPGTTELRAKVERLIAHPSARDAAEKQKTEASAVAPRS